MRSSMLDLRGFQCDERDSFAPEAAQIAWGRTLRFIDSHIRSRVADDSVIGAPKQITSFLRSLC